MQEEHTQMAEMGRPLIGSEALADVHKLYDPQPPFLWIEIIVIPYLTGHWEE